ncbi:MAG TPA: hypothetical protein VGT00_11685 [Methylomirabilota bacterium]|jgi:hypothetical protein|nr:hypothetical protein [Methylomirabilota bacterium]
MTKFIQICASQNDLFGLDDQGDVFQYNFKVKTWLKLIVERNSEEERPAAAAWSANGGAAMPSGEPTRHSRLRGPS